MTDAPPPSALRRRLLTGAALAGVGLWVWGVPRLSHLFTPEFTFDPIAAAPGFRTLTGTAGLTAGTLLTAGLSPPDPTLDAALAHVRADPCRALYGTDPAAVPIALFSDFNCPNCPTMDANVIEAVKDTPGTSLHRHELPLLGRTSVIASQAVLAADLQGKYAEMHAALLRTPAVTDLEFIRATATRSGLDADRLLADMTRPEITQALGRSKALSRLLGLYGTPATVIGQTVVLGTKPKATIAALIALEAERGQTCS